MHIRSHGATLSRPGIFVADSVTIPGPEVAGNVLIAGSHCGIYSAYLAARLKVRGVILNDAGIGLDQAGIAGLDYLQRAGIPAAAIGHESARIGNGEDTAARGVVAWVNVAARSLGCDPGQSAIGAAERLRSAPRANGGASEVREGRHSIDVAGAPDAVVALDSASLASEEDRKRILITASHGGLHGGDPRAALKVDVRAVFFNDAGVGCDRAGISRLPELDRRGIVAGTVSHWTARIGDARSSWETGVLSHVNRPAEEAGARPGMRLREFVGMIAR
jgi:hypothetical protein